MNKKEAYEYLQEKLEYGAHLSKIVLNSLSIDSITNWHEFTLQTDEENPNIIHKIGLQVAKTMIKEIDNLKNWIIILEDSAARCSDPYLITDPPPPDSYFCHTDDAFSERVYFYILPPVLRDIDLAGEIVGLATNAWQNVGYILEKQDGVLWVRKFFGDNNDLDSVLFISLQNIALTNTAFTDKINNIIESHYGGKI